MVRRSWRSGSRVSVQALMQLAVVELGHSPALEQAAQVWQNAGVPLLDSLHLASAETAGADVFATCDDELLKRAGRISTKLRTMGILDLFKELLP